MSDLKELAAIVFGDDAPGNFVTQWERLALEEHVEPDTVILRQLHPARMLYFVMEGRVEHRLLLDGQREQISLGHVSQAHFPLGWSGFVSPYRYATTALAASACRLYRWPIDELNRLFDCYPRSGRRFFTYVFATMQPLLEQSRQRIEKTPLASDVLRETLAQVSGFNATETLAKGEVRELLGNALFLEGLADKDLDALAGRAHLVRLGPGNAVYRRGDPTDQLLLLASGAVDIRYARTPTDDEVYLRSYSIPGQVVGGSAFDALDAHRESAFAVGETRLLRIAKRDIQQLCDASARFALDLERRWLWLLNARLRTLRLHVIAQQCNEEAAVIQDLLGQVSPQLPIDSPLYKLPHLLANRLTHADAFRCLDDVEQGGNGLERILGGLCRDLLAELRRELKFFDGLNCVYREVTEAPNEQSPAEVRHASCIAFQQAFRQVRYMIAGEDHLPERPGNIVILNHLISHPEYALANGFEFALDTHFVSAMVLEPAYGDCGVRVVRRGRGEEHGHHSYYDRLGHIYVYTSESDALNESDEQIAARRAGFTRTAGDILAAGRNLIICPEGTSNPIEDSPTRFRKGTFHLAAALDPEPFIVPIAVVNVDRRLKRNTIAAVVHEPFRLSDVCDPADRDSLNAFLDRFQKTYRGYVEGAIAMAAGA
ncbi:MAG: cyclic nucleotide-binding domain-containing protein [Gammaproteobacteria bacterium]|nr:cyclic nucleotide-binding domain-containing protein [Gammaproteobacteria bacterium]